MHNENLNLWQHDHTLGQENKRPGERRTFIVIVITGAMMVVEILTGILFGSMALLADGLHMASHAAALGINAFAYVYARRNAHDARFSFGTGKVNALGGFSGGALLAVFALLMAAESMIRLFKPVEIIFNQAILVAFVGLAVNGISVAILEVKDRCHGEENHHRHDHNDHDHGRAHNHDHNLKSAYLHVMADALTSVLAIVALLAAKHFGFVWMDPAMGILGAFMISVWSVSLLRVTAGVLLDRQGPESMERVIRERIEDDGDSRVSDLHLWSIGPNVYAVVIAIVAHKPFTPDEYKARLPNNLGLEHVSVEIHECKPDFLEKRENNDRTGV